MQVIIELPDDEYESIIYGGGIDDWQKQLVIEAIDNGMPLPKGHGNLKDVDKIIEELGCEDEAIIFEEMLREAPTIIEADTVI